MNRLIFAGSFPKNREDPNEDFYYVGNGHLVLCDGASESYDSRLWAKILGERFARYGEFSQRMLNKCREEYAARHDVSQFTWIQEAAYGRGSYSSFLAAICHEGGNTLELKGVGDSCAFFFIVRPGETKLLTSWPYDHIDQFQKRPFLLSSVPSKNINACGRNIFASKNIALRKNAACRLLLCSDALAAWVMRHAQNAEDMNQLLQIASADAFASFVLEKRSAKELHVDDTTLIHQELGQ